MVLKKTNQIKLRFKNLPQADALRKSSSYKNKISVFNSSLNNRTKIISENLILKINKKNISQNIDFLKKLKFKSDLNVLNLINVSNFSKDYLLNYLRDINNKYKLNLKIDNLSKPSNYIKEIYGSKKINLEERISIKFLLNFAKKSNLLTNKYKELLSISEKYKEINLVKYEKELLKKIEIDLENINRDSRISSQEAKESRNAEKRIPNYYKSLLKSKKENFLQIQERLKELNQEIISILPEVIASADLIEYIKKEEFLKNYKK